MIKLNSINVTGPGIKGRPVNMKLSGCDVVVGPNGSGKTTALLALLAARGGIADTDTDSQRPYLGPTKPSGTLITAWDVDSAPRVLRRSLGLSQRQNACKTTNALAEEIMGPHLVRWDLADFTAGGDKVRNALLKGVLRVAGANSEWTHERVAAELRGHQVAAAAVDDLLQYVSCDSHLPEWFSTAIGWARTEFTIRNRAQKEATAAAKAMANSNVPMPPGTLRDATEAVAALEEELGALREQVAAANIIRQVAAEHTARGDRWLAAVRRASDQRDAAEDALHVARRAASELGDVAKLESAASELGACVEVARRDERAAAQMVRSEEARHGGSVQMLHATRSRMQTLTELHDKIHGTCRECGCSDPLGLAEQVSDAADNLRTVEEEEAATAVDYRNAKEAWSAARLTKARLEQKSLCASRLVSDTGETMRAVDSARQRCDRAQQVLKSAEGDLVAWQLTKVQQPPSVEHLTAQRTALESRLGDSRRPAEGTTRWLVQQHRAAQGRETELQMAVARREEIQAEFEAIKALGQHLKRIESMVAQAAYQPVCAAAQWLLDAAEAGLQVVIHSESDIGAVVSAEAWPEARLDKDIYVTLWELSDSQAAMVGGALAVAFAELSGAPWRGLVLDRMETIDGHRLPAFLRGMARAVGEGHIDNFLAALVAVNQDELPEVTGVAWHWTGRAVQSGWEKSA